MTIKDLVKTCHDVAIKKGWWGDVCDCPNPRYSFGGDGENIPFCGKCLKLLLKQSRNDGELIALMHSELSEALEELRKKSCDMNKVGEELADCVIRIMDYCGARSIDLEKLLLDKIEINKTRPHRHGKAF
jgi:hypothetical protein